ncbi:hypothetical protein SAMN04487987_11154 [Algibacter pectinivorans]|uniref:Uncharacterized protein n=1 Tax=Algibacter pectinivorans TaxID=870482 RepID=A0A1I1S3Q1_9FLAO|nr:hypothetical protein SAMN04487987_11154 [Algibacter pectinivorans]
MRGFFIFTTLILLPNMGKKVTMNEFNKLKLSLFGINCKFEGKASNF